MSHDGESKPGSTYDPSYRQTACRCGSGRKYKKCCALREHEELRQAWLKQEAMARETPHQRSKAATTALLLAGVIGAGVRR